jgi:hypothetical protein
MSSGARETQVVREDPRTEKRTFKLLVMALFWISKDFS